MFQTVMLQFALQRGRVISDEEEPRGASCCLHTDTAQVRYQTSSSGFMMSAGEVRTTGTHTEITPAAQGDAWNLQNFQSTGTISAKRFSF